MVRSTPRLPCELLFTVVLVSIIFYSVAAEAMLLGQSAGAQQPTFGPDSTLAQVLEIGTTYSTTSPSTWESLQRSYDNSNTLYYPVDDIGPQNETNPQFVRPLRFDDTEEGDDVPTFPWSICHSTRDHSEHEDNNDDNAILEEPSPVQSILDDFELQQQDAMLPSTESSSYDFPSMYQDSTADSLMPLAFSDPPRRTTSPSASLLDFSGSERNLRLSPEESVDEAINPPNRTSTVTDNYLSEPFNFGDRFDPQVGYVRANNILEIRFNGENTPSQPHPYPTSIPLDAFTVVESGSSPEPNRTGKKIYSYKCDIHGLVFNDKEMTIVHFRTVHGRTDVNKKNAHPCTHPGCRESRRHPKDLKKHLTTHTRDRRFDCVCGNTYTRKDNLLRHQKGHKGSHPCDLFKRQQQRQV